jgi:hypothetical protein
MQEPQILVGYRAFLILPDMRCHTPDVARNRGH